MAKERLGGTLAKAAVVGMLSAGSLYGSAPVEYDHVPASYDTDLAVCYDKPSPQLKRPKVASLSRLLSNKNDLVVRQNSGGEAAADYPGPIPQDAAGKLAGAVVKISVVTPEGLYGIGTGFVVENNREERVVATAAHVALAAPLGDLAISDTSGNISHIQSGCYVDGSEGRAKPLHDEEVDQIDTAILRTAESIGSSSLTLAHRPPRRGQWVGFYNFQDNRELTSPANYQGKALDTQSPTMSNTALTGLGDENRQLAQTTIVGGASGGPVVDVHTAEVYGMSVSAAYVPHDMMDTYGVRYESFYSSSADQATVAGFVDAIDIQHALATNNY